MIADIKMFNPAAVCGISRLDLIYKVLNRREGLKVDGLNFDPIILWVVYS